VALSVAACGGATPTLPTPSPGPTVAPMPSPSAVRTATPAPTPSIAAVPLSQFAAVAGSPGTADSATGQALAAELQNVRAKYGYPGMSAAVIMPDGSMWTGVAGSAVLSTRQPITPATIFSVASISKTFVSAVIGRLVQDGRLRLDDPLSKFVAFPNAAHISIRELLDHTSGIRDLFDILNKTLLANPTQAWTTSQVLAAVGARAYFKPGASYRYSNTDYVLLGAVAEKVTGKNLAALVRSYFLVPLGMKHTFLQTEEKASGAKAHGYIGSAKTPVANYVGTMLPFTAEATAASFAGAYVSTASDLAIWANALYGGYVLDADTLASIVDISPTARFAGQGRMYGVGYGLGLEESTVDGTVSWGHRGHLDGFNSAMEYLPAYHVSIVVLINAEWADPMTTVADLAGIAIA
jgi:D-alanyl-D-alanine carboxypeptidase